MKKTVVIIVYCLVCVLMAVGAYFWVTGSISSNYAFRSPLKETPPTPGQALGKASTRRVVIVLIDGLRYDTSMKTEVMPVLNQLRAEGAQAMMHSEVPSYSQPGYTTILTGAWPWINDGPAFNQDFDKIPTWTQDNLFSAAHRAGYITAISGYNWFQKLVPQKDVDLSFYTAGEENAADISDTVAATEWLKANMAQLVLIHLDQVDYAGHHQGGPISKNWTDAATRADGLLGQIAATLDLSKDTLLVISDHGQVDLGGHGGQDPICLKEPFVLVGAGVVPGNYGDVNMVDVAPTLAALLGTNLPADAQGQVRTAMLKLYDSVKAALPDAVKAQQTQLLKAYAKAIGSQTYSLPTGSDVAQYQTVMQQLRENRVISERIPRAIFAALLLALIVYWLIRQWKKGSYAWLAGGLAFEVLFNFVYHICEGKGYSVSYISSVTLLIVDVVSISAGAFLIAYLLIFFWQKYDRLPFVESTEMVLGSILGIAFVAAIPAFVHFVINGLLITWTLPNYAVSFLFILAAIQLLVIGVMGLIFAGINFLLGRKRAGKAAPEATA